MKIFHTELSKKKTKNQLNVMFIEGGLCEVPEEKNHRSLSIVFFPAWFFDPCSTRNENPFF